MDLLSAIFLLNALVMNQQWCLFMSVSLLTAAAVTFPCQQQIVAVNLFVGSLFFLSPFFYLNKNPVVRRVPLDPSSNTADLFSITQLKEMYNSLKGDIHIFNVFF